MKTSFSYQVENWTKTVWNDSYNIEGNTFLSIYYPFTNKLKLNYLSLAKPKVNMILSMPISYFGEIEQTTIGSLGIRELIV